MGRPIVFLGTPRAAVTVLQSLIPRHNIELVITRPDTRRGRGAKTSPSPVKEVAIESGLRVEHSLDALRQLPPNPERLGVVVAYGKIIPTDVLDVCPMVNVHFSLLPRWRGAAPVERAIMAGDATTGVCIMDVEPTLDTGGVHAVSETVIEDTDTAASLTHRLSEMGAALLLDVLERPSLEPVPQSGDATYAHKIESSERVVMWSGSSTDIWRRSRAIPCYALLKGKRIGLTEVVDVSHAHGSPGVLSSDLLVYAEHGAVRLIRVQPEGKKPMSASDWLRGMQTTESIVFETSHSSRHVKN
jgi:methionyl-tRNA formyltransferase